MCLLMMTLIIYFLVTTLYKTSNSLWIEYKSKTLPCFLHSHYSNVLTGSLCEEWWILLISSLLFLYFSTMMKILINFFFYFVQFFLTIMWQVGNIVFYGYIQNPMTTSKLFTKLCGRLPLRKMTYWHVAIKWAIKVFFCFAIFFDHISANHKLKKTYWSRFSCGCSIKKLSI